MGIIIYYSCTVVVIIYLLEFTKGSTSIAQEASIRQLIEAYRDFNASDEDIIKKLMSKFGISEDIAKDYIKKFELQPV